MMLTAGVVLACTLKSWLALVETPLVLLTLAESEAFPVASAARSAAGTGTLHVPSAPTTVV